MKHCSKHDIDYSIEIHELLGRNIEVGACPECIQDEAKATAEEERLAAEQELNDLHARMGITPRFANKTFDNYKPKNEKAAHNLKRS